MARLFPDDWGRHRSRSPKVRAVLVLALALASDPWAYFQPENVTRFVCKVSDVQLQAVGEKVSHPMWEAEASATRKDGTTWGMVIGEFPPTTRGRHAAEKACSKWMDEASKRIKSARSGQSDQK